MSRIYMRVNQKEDISLLKPTTQLVRASISKVILKGRSHIIFSLTKTHDSKVYGKTNRDNSLAGEQTNLFVIDIGQ